MISETSSKEHTITKKSNENKKYYKIIVRNLPPRDFIEEDFDKCIQSACLELQKTFGNSLEGPIMTKSNFVTGKVR